MPVARTLIDATGQAPRATPAHEGGAHEMDERLLATLERSFARLAGSDARIDAKELQEALGLRSEYLARRVLAAFDRDRDGVISRDEFIAGVRALIFGSDRDKLYFVFRVHDHDGDGVITRVEMLRIVMLSLAEDDVTVRQADAERVVDTLFLEADRGRDGRITFEELEAVVRAHPEVLAQITRSETRWIAPNEELLARIEEQPGLRARLARAVENRGLLLLSLALWGAANVALFAAAVLRYHALGANGLVQLARGCGACLNFNGALILVPMMRHLLTWIRGTPLGRAVPVDEAVGFHRLVGHAMFAFGLVHTAAHLANYALSRRARFLDQLLFTKAGLTGLVLLVVFAVMWFFSRAAIRRSGRFELFYFTHLLYVAWLGLALAHGPVFWIWAGVPIAGFVVEQLLRARRRGRAAEIVAGHALRSGVTRLAIRPPAGFTHRAGDYLFLRVPEVAAHEWHPFTISSAPGLELCTVHVRTLGNWTAALRRLVEQKHARGSHAPLVCHIDGPYGTPSAHIFESRFAVLIGAGIGVTPFASVLESIVLRAQGKGGEPSRLSKAHFFWLNRDQYSFEWFSALLAHLEAEDRGGLLDIHIHMTGGRGNITASSWNLGLDILHAAGHRDLLTGLRAQTKMGHPDWERELERIAARHAPEPVDVYFCGPHGLAAKLRPICERLGMRFRQEHF